MLAAPRAGFEELFNLLFPEERADLDFGLYRLLNARRETLRQFFRDDLPALLERLSKTASADAEIEAEMSILGKKAEELGVALDQIPRYGELQLELAQSGSAVLAGEAVSRLRAFIGRHYVDGDFIPMRRYRSDAYLIPYDGSETAFIFANQDQFFTKSDQLFETFRVRLPDDRRVTCTVTYAEERLGNNEDNTKQKRRFKLLNIELTERELTLGFAFVPSEKATQESLNDQALAQAQERLASTPWFSEMFRAVSGKPWLIQLIERFTKNVERDYFVHKALKRFLTEELDRYIFTDVFPRVTVHDGSALRMASRVEVVLRGIAEPLITLLSQFEDLQRDLWTKPRLVTQSAYCITLDRLPLILLPEALANGAQRAEWDALYGISADSVVSPKTHPGLFVDTRHFGATFFASVEASIGNLDNSVDGLVVVSENTGALRTYARRLKGGIDAIYIDPPFNTGSGSAFRYKNGYRHSSWCCLMQDSLGLGGQVLANDGVLAIAIDDTEFARLQMLADRVFGDERRLGTQVFVTKPGGRSRDRFLATCHEYTLYYASAGNGATISFAPLTEAQKAEYKFVDAEGNRYKWRDFMRTGGLSIPRDRPHSYYSILWHQRTNAVVVFADPDPKAMQKAKAEKALTQFLELPGASKRTDLDELAAYVFVPNGKQLPPLEEFTKIEPVDTSGQTRVWRKTRLPFMLHVAKGEIQFTDIGGRWKVAIKDPEKRGTRPNSVASEKSFNATVYGTKLLQDMFGESRVFSYPKALGTVRRALENTVADDEEAIVCDYFAGSGTTGHAIIDMNRDGGNRKYVLVEMAEYVDDVTIPRLKKAAYSSAWKKGRPTENDAVPHTIKIVRLESYEDALENVALRQGGERDEALDMFPEFRREFLPARLIQDDVKASSAFLPTSVLKGGATMTIAVLDHDGKRHSMVVDLSETLSIWFGIIVDRRRRRDGMEVTLGWIGEDRCALVVRDVSKSDSLAVARFVKETIGDETINRVIINGDVSLEVLRREGIQAEVQTVEELLVEAG